MRQHEFKSDEANSFLFFLIDGNSRYDLDSCSTMLIDVQAILNLTTNETLEHLHRLKHFPKYIQ